ncbi:homocysteine S-methyltransferase family protein [Desulfopila sp. IMCC35008]|uniref:homocysteine S-methyltransferase family protein n=1 Tax=Desulfopila sp. IMCC35008 TaxID=2653858 RepID=UPI0013D4D502|nr:homocysteine S-methyltransferase family protein [Desulfopila sp. IMCC35008]
MNFTQTLARAKAMLTEGAIAERLRRRDDVELHPTLFNTPLIQDEHGRQCMEDIYRQYRNLAAQAGLPMLICAPTWRVDRARIKAAGFSEGLNREAVRFMRELQVKWQRAQSPLFVGGLIGPKNDCYAPDEALSADEAREYHSWQIRELAESGVDCIIGQTFPAVSEALGVGKAAREAGIPYIISFCINRHAMILDGTPLYEGIQQLDRELKESPAGYMVNCVFPTFIQPKNQPPELFTRLVGIQANASSKDHDQLDNAETLQQDSRDEWVDLMLELNRRYGVKILGGCCGTDEHYIGGIAKGLAEILT